MNNNDWNLEWTTRGENNRYAIRDGLVEHKSSTQAWNASLTDEDVRYIRQAYIPGHPEFSAVALARKFSVPPSTIRDVIHFRRYKDVS